VSADEPRSNGSDTDGHESTLESSAPRTKAQGAAKQAGKPNAFPATRRLKRRADFLRIQSSSIRVSTAHFAWLYAFHLPDAKATCCRLGLVVSKKVGNAVARNRVKRLVREAFRLQPNAFREDADLVVIARGGADRLLLDDVRRELLRASSDLARRAGRKSAGGALATPASEAQARRAPRGTRNR
jgi:ribonuclease P protein component